LLRTETRNLEFVEYDVKENSVQRRWNEIRNQVCSLIDYRLEYASGEKWYRDYYIADKQEFLDMPFLDNLSDINCLPNGIIAEVFFMESCRRMDLNCTPTTGEEDIWGVDFKIDNGIEARFLDVSINISDKGLQKKNKAGTYPTIFIPWRPYSIGKGREISYAEQYLSTGVFSQKKFISGIISYNRNNLHALERSVWKDAKWGEGYMGLEGILYIKDLKDTIDMLKGGYR
jgi:hypothetical protein